MYVRPFHFTVTLFFDYPSTRSVHRQGAGPRGALVSLSQYMLSSAATFGFFLSIGSVSLIVGLLVTKISINLPGNSK